MKTPIDFILLRKRNLEMANNIQVIPSEECVPQHKLLTCELRLKTQKPHPKPFSPKFRYCKLKEQTVQKEIERVFTLKVNAFNTAAALTKGIWSLLKIALLDTTNETCSKTKKRHHKRVIWWWKKTVLESVEAETLKEQYQQAKRNLKRTVYTAKKIAEVKKFSDLKPGMNDIFKISKQLKSDNQDVVGNKCVKDDSGNLFIDNKV